MKSLLLCLLLSLHFNLFAANPSLQAPITIKADKLEYQHKTGTITHTGHVVVTQADKTLKAHTMVILKEPKSQNFSQIIAKGMPKQPATFTGKLTLEQTPITAQAQTITYFPETQKLILEDNAILTKENNTFKSPVINFDLASSSVTALKDDKTRPTLIIYKK